MVVHRTNRKAWRDGRRAVRHKRRYRKTRYRPARFQNRRHKAGGLPPSLNGLFHKGGCEENPDTAMS